KVGNARRIGRLQIPDCRWCVVERQLEKTEDVPVRSAPETLTGFVSECGPALCRRPSLVDLTQMRVDERRRKQRVRLIIHPELLIVLRQLCGMDARGLPISKPALHLRQDL